MNVSRLDILALRRTLLVAESDINRVHAMEAMSAVFTQPLPLADGGPIAAAAAATTALLQGLAQTKDSAGETRGPSWSRMLVLGGSLLTTVLALYGGRKQSSSS
jgi:hypothetical protein